jgi:acyl transferase domain-containing protein
VTELSADLARTYDHVWKNPLITRWYRGQSSKRTPSSHPKGMLAIGIGEAALAEYLEQKDTKIQIACYNSPSSLTLSGLTSELEELRDRI